MMNVIDSGIDGGQIGQVCPVPEPGTVALLGIGLLRGLRFATSLGRHVRCKSSVLGHSGLLLLSGLFGLAGGSTA